MWRPCHARTYFDSDATAAAIAIPASATRSSVGRSTNSRMCAVMSEDSSRHGSSQDRAGPRHPPPRTRARAPRASRRARAASGATSPKNDSSERDDGERREREQREAVHRDAAEHGEDPVPDRREGRARDASAGRSPSTLAVDEQLRTAAGRPLDAAVGGHPHPLARPTRARARGPPSKNSAVAIASARIAVSATAHVAAIVRTGTPVRASSTW